MYSHCIIAVKRCNIMNEKKERKKSLITVNFRNDTFSISAVQIYGKVLKQRIRLTTVRGELSKQVRFLKTEEGGIKIMCEIMERIREEGKREGMKSGIREGIKSGMLESHKKTAWNLEKMGMPLDSIAKVVEKDISVVRQWLKPAK